MPDTKDTFAELDTILSSTISIYKNEDLEDDVEMATYEQVALYIADQIEVAKQYDEDPLPRLEAMAELVKLAKAWSWEDDSTMPLPLYRGDLSVQDTSAFAERIGPVDSDGIHEGVGFSTPDARLEVRPSQRSGGAFEDGPTQPTQQPTAFIDPKESIMPPAFPKVTPEQNYISKADQDFIQKQINGGEALIGELRELLNSVAESTDGEGEFREDEVAKSDEWPTDLSTSEFLEGVEEKRPKIDFGDDPPGLGRGKIVLGI